MNNSKLFFNPIIRFIPSLANDIFKIFPYKKAIRSTLTTKFNALAKHSPQVINEFMICSIVVSN